MNDRLRMVPFSQPERRPLLAESLTAEAYCRRMKQLVRRENTVFCDLMEQLNHVWRRAESLTTLPPMAFQPLTITVERNGDLKPAVKEGFLLFEHEMEERGFQCFVMRLTQDRSTLAVHIQPISGLSDSRYNRVKNVVFQVLVYSLLTVEASCPRPHMTYNVGVTPLNRTQSTEVMMNEAIPMFTQHLEEEGWIVKQIRKPEPGNVHLEFHFAMQKEGKRSKNNV